MIPLVLPTVILVVVFFVLLGWEAIFVRPKRLDASDRLRRDERMARDALAPRSGHVDKRERNR